MPGEIGIESGSFLFQHCVQLEMHTLLVFRHSQSDRFFFVSFVRGKSGHAIQTVRNIQPATASVSGIVV